MLIENLTRGGKLALCTLEPFTSFIQCPVFWNHIETYPSIDWPLQRCRW
jgi:hypothetical protein